MDGASRAAATCRCRAIAPGGRAEVAIPGFAAAGGPGAASVWLTLRFRWPRRPSAGRRPGSRWAGRRCRWMAVRRCTGRRRTPSTPPGPATSQSTTRGLAPPRVRGAPRLALWRAPTDNDRIGGMAERWAGWGLADLRRTLVSIERSDDAVDRAFHVDDRQRASRSRTSTALIARDAAGRIRVEETAEIPEALADLPRVGTILDAAWRATRRWPGSDAVRTRRTRTGSAAARVGRWSVHGDRPARALRPAAGERRPRGRPLAGAAARDGRGVRITLDRPRQVSVLHHDGRGPGRRPARHGAAPARGDHRHPGRRAPRGRHGELRSRYARGVPRPARHATAGPGPWSPWRAARP